MFERHKETHLFFEKNPLTIQKNKTFFRNSFKKKAEGISLSTRKQKQNQILKQLYKLPFWPEADFIAGYKALKSEPSLESFYKLWKSKMCYPVVQKDKLEFYKQSSRWSKSSLSILEPVVKKQNQIPLDKISVFLIPGLAFDRRGGRLGRGKGCYDKTLASLHKDSYPFCKRNKKSFKRSSKSLGRLKALFIGVAFAEQVYNEKLPLMEHDILFDVLVTDQFVLTPLDLELKTLTEKKFKKVKKIYQLKKRGKGQ